MTPNGREEFWTTELAALDSDGDGIANGIELGDPAGEWTPDSEDPGDLTAITHPGDSASFIEQTTVRVFSWGLVKDFLERLDN